MKRFFLHVVLGAVVREKRRGEERDGERVRLGRVERERQRKRHKEEEGD